MGSHKPHAVCLPCPGQGHIYAMLKFAKLLHSKGFHITFVHTEFNYNRILNSSSGATALEGADDFHFEIIPDGLPSSDENSNQDMKALTEAMQNNLSAPFRSLVKRLTDVSSGVPPVTCIVSDAVMSFTLEVAEELRLPDVFFSSVSACCNMALLHFKHLIDRGIVPLKSESDLTNGYLDTQIDWIPGMKNIRLRDLPSFVRTTDPNDFFFNFLNAEAQRAFQATAIVINTFDDLEQQVLNALSSILPPIYTVGPVSLHCHQLPTTLPTALNSNLLKEDEHCIKWLDEREIGSVLYVNFGSMAIISRQQLMEFAWGFANANHYFLWVLRPDLVQGEDAALPQEFLAAIEGKGFLASWCSQEQVLAHASVGGFLTHCGWNSTMESVCSGVPMICWPCFCDQQTNCRYICNEWGIGMELDSDVKREQVEELVKEMMEGERGKEMKKKAAEWKESAMRATRPGGSSCLNLDRVIKEVLLR